MRHQISEVDILIVLETVHDPTFEERPAVWPALGEHPAEGHVEHLPRILVVEQLRQSPIIEGLRRRHALELTRHMIGPSLVLVERASEVEDLPEEIGIANGDRPKRLEVARPRGLDVDAS